LLPKRIDDSGYCPFFNLSQRTCGIYGVRPFACRIYYNPETSRHYCQNPNDATLQLFDGVKRHVEAVLGSYVGGYQYNEAQR
jgi:Fe-S-cluster containining protein